MKKMASRTMTPEQLETLKTSGATVAPTREMPKKQTEFSDPVVAPVAAPATANGQEDGRHRAIEGVREEMKKMASRTMTPEQLETLKTSGATVAPTRKMPKKQTEFSDPVVAPVAAPAPAAPVSYGGEELMSAIRGQTAILEQLGARLQQSSAPKARVLGPLTTDIKRDEDGLMTGGRVVGEEREFEFSFDARGDDRLLSSGVLIDEESGVSYMIGFARSMELLDRVTLRPQKGDRMLTIR